MSPTAADRPDPSFARPAAPAGDGRGSGSPLRFPADARRAERPTPAFTAGERLTVASEITGGDTTRRDDGARRSGFGALRLTLFAVLVVLAGIGAMTVYRAIAGVLPG